MRAEEGGWRRGEHGAERTIPCTDHSTELSNPQALWAVEARMET